MNWYKKRKLFLLCSFLGQMAFFTIRILFLVVLISLGFCLARQIGVWYYQNILIWLPPFLANDYLNFLVCCVVLLYLNVLENRYVWGRFITIRKTTPGYYEPTPFSLSVMTGFYSAWIDSEQIILFCWPSIWCYY